ncbi:hypothetical protein NL676_029532 [Syzygium grande]|nr:hypothetical protein NL676_029532 [Syzygium grande]
MSPTRCPPHYPTPPSTISAASATLGSGNLRSRPSQRNLDLVTSRRQRQLQFEVRDLHDPYESRIPLWSF